MGFLESYQALTDPRQQIALIAQWLVENPNEMFAELRAQKPVFITPGPVIVSHYRDVMEVANLDDVYSVKPYGVAMMRDNGVPNFILGMDNGAQFENDLSLLHLAVKRTDLDRIRGIVARHAQAVIEQASSVGRLDIADGYGRLVPTLFAGEYFGVPGPDASTLMAWVRAMFADIFFNFTNDPNVSAAGVAAGITFRAYVDGLIRDRQTSKDAPKDDVLGRLVAMQVNPDASFTSDRIRDNLIGCVTGILENTNTAVVTIIDYLFNNPDVMKQTLDAVAADDNDRLLSYVLEIMRFHTPAPVLVRLSLADHVLAKGTPNETLVPAGKVVIAATASAMMDETELDNPQAFVPGRPAHHYLHFGWGIHQCLGKYISHVQLVELVKALLKQRGLRRADGADGTLTYAGPYPKSFTVAFDAVAATTGRE